MLTVIIPTRNEEKTLARTLKTATGADIMVVDTGSTDATVAIAKKYATVVQHNGTRAAAQNYAARKAKGDILLFLHADTRLPAGWLAAVENALRDTRVIGGSFCLRFASTHPLIMLGSWYICLRTLLAKRFYGDQGIFVRTAVFKTMRGFKNQALMEDYELCSRLRKRGKLAIIKKPVVTSARRYEQRGIIRNHLVNQFMKLCYWLGVNRQTMQKLYGMIR